MTDRRAALLQAVLDEPDDDAPRLVYADELLAAGDPRGELIVVEHRLLTQRDGDLHARRNALRREHAARWWPELRAPWIRTRCGFVEGIAVQPSDLAEIAPLVVREPVRELEVYNGTINADSIWLLPDVPRLVLRTAMSGDVTVVLDSPMAARLESLDLSGAPIHRLDFGDRLPACRRLGLARGGFWLDELFGWHHIGSLRELDISVSDVDHHELSGLFARAPELRILRLSGNPLGDDGGRVIANALRKSSKLARLEIIGCGIDRTTVQAIRHASSSLVVISEHARSTCTIDLMGSVLELVPAPEDGYWHAWVDGQRRRIWHSLAETTSHDEVPIVNPREDDAAPLDQLVDAIALGWPRQLTRDGATMYTTEMAARILLDDSDEAVRILIDSG